MSGGEPTPGDDWRDLHPLVSLVAAVFSVFVWTLAWARTLVAFVTIKIPIFIYAVLSYSLTLTINFYTLLGISIAAAIFLSYYIRYRYLNDYADLKEPPLDKPNATSLHPDIAAAADDLAAPRFSNYLDEFLQAIRVFGFLEKPVFHELARHLQTRRLIAGDTLALDQDLSFYCVVDGHVQVFAETGRHVDSWDDDYGNSGGYQLLNEVGPGGTLSSLFTILSLFTEDVRISWQDNTGDQYPQENENKDVSHLDIANDTGTARPILRRASLSSSGSTALATASNPRFAMSPTRTPLVGGVMTPGSERSSTYRQGALPSEPGSEMQDDYVYSTGVQSEHKDPRNPMRQGTIARATVDTTLAVIPAEAFRRLTHKFPKASAHIVQVILTRFSRVTFNAMHKYLGLTVELLRTEKAINELACHPLPNAFYSGGGMQRLRQRFAAVPHAEEEDEQAVQTEDDTVTDSDDYFGKIAHHRGSSIGSGTISAGSINVNTPLPDRPVVNQHRRARFPEGRDIAYYSFLHLESPISQTPSQRVLQILRRRHLEFYILHAPMSKRVTYTLCGQMNEPENYPWTGEPWIPRRIDTARRIYIWNIRIHRVSSYSVKPPKRKNTTASPELKAYNQSKPSKHLFTVKTGGIAGYLASLTGPLPTLTSGPNRHIRRLPTITCLGETIGKTSDRVVDSSKTIDFAALSTGWVLLNIDASLDWQQVDAGQVLWRPGEPSDSFYMVLNGRLRALTEKEEGVDIVGEYGQGDTVGELDVITSSSRRTTLHAIRDTELARMPMSLFNAISIRHPQTTVQLLRMIASRVRNEVDQTSINPRQQIGSKEIGRNNPNLKTVCILPSTRDVPVVVFATKLQAALEDMGAPTSFLTQASVTRHLGRHAFTKLGKLKAAGWLAEQNNGIGLCCMLGYAVGSPGRRLHYGYWMGDDPTLGEYERLLMGTKTTARRELVLLHPNKNIVPGSTREWLKNRPWVHGHTHVELPGLIQPEVQEMQDTDAAAIIAFNKIKNKVQLEIQKYTRSQVNTRPHRPKHFSDFSRLARRLCGKSVGLVLGGGGARGIAHLGVIRALEDRGIPIDHIGGTSIGAFIGGLYAREGDILSSALRAKQFSGRMSSVWRILSDVTWPVVAYTTATFSIAGSTRSCLDLVGVFKLAYRRHVAAILLQHNKYYYFRMDIHDTGYAWRYIRASMTLVGLLPPLCDNGTLLVDGGYVDNLPVSTMLSHGASIVFAVDVGSLYDNSPRNYGDTVSGWWVVLNRWNPFSSTRNIPDITDIQGRLTYVSSVPTLEEAKITPGCFYMQMPVHEFGTLQFGRYDEIYQVGYSAAVDMLDQWDAENRLPSRYVTSGDDVRGLGKAGKKSKGRSLRRNSI
ncbi:Lysophospholipase NTE1 [Rhizoctonia solani]|uniref:Lysophospholipase NTE1 n=1 Tax=Rhizoctonia solani TaxID=456999 RepID=A0A8H7M5J9_9AGAM|nr:Lysophospholipase NTE1 [Rhizoctonia solani]